MMHQMKQAKQAEQFFKLHQQDSPFILLNVWDAASAAIFEQAGAPAIATSSAAIAVSFGYPDGEQLPFETLLDVIKRITATIKIPLSVDFEAGFTKDTQKLLHYVDQLIEAGAVGINLEDRYPDLPNQLIPIQEQVIRIKAIKDHIKQSNKKLFINARTDVYWARHIDFDNREAEALKRLKVYEAAGADGLFIPGLNDFGTLSNFTQTLSCPINILGGENLDYSKTQQAGIKRISVGSLPMRFALTHLHSLGQSVLQGQFDRFENILSYDALMMLAPHQDQLNVD